VASNVWRVSSVVLAVLVSVGCGSDPERAKLEYLASGDRYVGEKRYNEAILQYRNALQQDPRFGEARLKLARTYEQLGDLRGAHREYIRAADALPESVEAQVKAGAYLLLAQQFEDAKARAQAALALEPTNVDAQLLLGNALGGLRDLDGALRQLEEAIKLDPASAAAYTGVGALRLAKGGPQAAEAAEAAFRKAVETNPNMPLAHVALANFYWSTRRDAEAEAALKQALVVDPQNAIAHRSLATLYMATRRAAHAEPHLKALADSDTSAAGGLKLALADFYVMVNRPDDAMRVLDSLANQSDAAASADTRRAAIQYARAGREDGHKLVDAVLARDPKNVQALLVKTRFLMSEGKFDQALTTAQSAAAADPRSIQAHYLMGTVFRAKRRTPEAIGAFEEVLKINPRAAAAQVQLAQLNIEAGKANTALQLATDAARQAPGDPRVRLTLLRTLVANKQLDQAEKTSAALLQSYPQAAPVHAAAGTVAAARGDSARARRAYDRALELDPRNHEAISGLVRLDLREKKGDAARARLERQLAAAPTDVAVMTLAARVYATTGDLKRSEELLRKIIETDPTNLAAYGMLGQLYASQNRLPEARASFETIVEDRPDAVGVNTLIGMLLEAEGKLDEARQRYERILQIDPGAAVAANNLAYRYAEDGGNLDIALQLAQTARQKLPDSAEVADTLGWIYVKKDLASLAIPRLEEAVAKSPETAMLHYHLGLALTKAGQRIRARQVLERALTLNLPEREAAEARRVLTELTS
jgi:tetratricopeptide (TPR) repeat protein